MPSNRRSLWEWLLIIIAIISTIAIIPILIMEIYLAGTATKNADISFHIGVILAILQGGSLLFLVIYVIKTWEMASATRQSADTAERTVQEMIRVRQEDTAPYIIAIEAV
jgi:hypothetical protein